uniref:Uncharacterized protein n=1 Tax=viral metagenome TaxID=1070528 RepID=A0A6C0E154_9ZZZZ
MELEFIFLNEYKFITEKTILSNVPSKLIDQSE